MDMGAMCMCGHENGWHDGRPGHGGCLADGCGCEWFGRVVNLPTEDQRTAAAKVEGRREGATEALRWGWTQEPDDHFDEGTYIARGLAALGFDQEPGT